MLKKFTVKNYKNFRDELSINFEGIAGYQFSMDCVTDGLIGKMLIYGRNATGKTNLGRALMDISSTLFSTPRFVSSGPFLNADSSEDSAIFSYQFRFDNSDLIYRYSRYSELKLREEELIIDGRTIFTCDYANKKYNFDNLKWIGAETANTERYRQSLDSVQEAEEDIEPKLPFLRWLIGNVAFRSDSILIKLSNYVRRMVLITVGNAMPYRYRKVNDYFYESLEDPDNLGNLEDFLNAMGIACKLVLKKLPDGQRELYFSHKKLVPFYENASSGTLALVDLYRRFISNIKEASFLYLDEFDVFYHYEMAENVIRFFKKKYPECQMIMTSHNTNLMTNRLMRPDCLFILSGTGSLTALCDATSRELREGHNLKKMYISGEFDRYE